MLEEEEGRKKEWLLLLLLETLKAARRAKTAVGESFEPCMYPHDEDEQGEQGAVDKGEEGATAEGGRPGSEDDTFRVPLKGEPGVCNNLDTLEANVEDERMRQLGALFTAEGAVEADSVRSGREGEADTPCE